jgi:hypothetical protein
VAYDLILCNSGEPPPVFCQGGGSGSVTSDIILEADMIGTHSFSLSGMPTGDSATVTMTLA